jgi:hypothetical protein
MNTASNARAWATWRNVYSENYGGHKLSRFIYPACSEPPLLTSSTPTLRLTEGQNLEKATSDSLQWFYILLEHLQLSQQESNASMCEFGHENWNLACKFSVKDS